jgi:hypothetical protein
LLSPYGFIKADGIQCALDAGVSVGTDQILESSFNNSGRRRPANSAVVGIREKTPRGSSLVHSRDDAGSAQHTSHNPADRP